MATRLQGRSSKAKLPIKTTYLSCLLKQRTYKHMVLKWFELCLAYFVTQPYVVK